jgi:hypothetical protein
MANDINKEDPHYKGEYGSIYEVNRKFPTGGVAGDFVVIDGWAHYWNADRGTWCVNAERDSYWDELITNIIEKFKLVRGATYMGVASLDTVPTKVIGAKMYYFATVAGTYKKFDNLVVPQGINVLYSENGSSWVNTTLLEVAQELGVSNKKVMSQKAVSDKLSDLSEHIGASIENSFSGKFNNISIDGNTLTIKKEGFSLFVLGKRIAFYGTEDKVFNSDNNTIRKSIYLNMKYVVETNNLTQVNFTENEDVFIEKIDSTYNGLLFAEWYQGKLMQTGLVAGFKLLSDTNKQITDTNKQIVDTNKQLLNSNKIQIYLSDKAIPYIEETKTDKVYVVLSGSICVRAANIRTLQQLELLTELGVDGETSPNGVQNCFAISSLQSFVFNISDSKFKIISRDIVTDKDVVLIANVGGSVNISESKNFLAQWYDNRINKAETSITSINSSIANTNVTFSTKSVYNKGDIVNYKGVSYIFKLPHIEGEWNTEEVQPISNLSLSYLSNLTIENALSGKYDNISIDGNTLTIKKEGFSLFVLGKRITFSGTEYKVFTGTGIRNSLYLNPYYLINNSSVNFTENEDVFVLKQDALYNGVLFAEWYQGKLMHTGLVAGFKLLSDTNKQITDTNKQIVDTNKQLLNSNKIQIYLSDKAIPYIEEDRTNSKVYVYLTGNICVRMYGSGRTIQQQALAEEMGIELTTSPLGKENCFVINDGYDFVFDLLDGKFKIISRNLVGANHVVLIVSLGGSVNISESKNFLAQWYADRISKAEKNIEDFESYVDKGKNIRIRNNVALNSDFKAIFFSDVHGASENVKRIKEKAISWKSQYVDCILNGGDTVQSFNSEGLGWYNQLVQDSAIPFISAVGNHDAWSTNYWTWDNNENIYNLLTSKVKEYVPSIVQPTDVNTTHANYYYYDTEKVRVIVLLSLTFKSSDVYYDEAQDTWLKSVLADAKENNKAVIIMNHGPIDPKDCEEIECNWTSKFSWVNDVQDYQHMDNRILENVDSFIDSGGKFICYLAGHSHLDYILRSKKHPRQMCLVITSARYSYGSDCARSQSKNNMDYDSYNYIGVDLTHSVIKVQRIGMNTNAWMQEHNTMCWDFKNSKLISDN